MFHYCFQLPTSPSARIWYIFALAMTLESQTFMGLLCPLWVLLCSILRMSHVTLFGWWNVGGHYLYPFKQQLLLCCMVWFSLLLLQLPWELDLDRGAILSACVMSQNENTHGTEIEFLLTCRLRWEINTYWGSHWDFHFYFLKYYY